MAASDFSPYTSYISIQTVHIYIAAAVAVDAVADGGRLVDEDAASASDAVVEAGSRRVAPGAEEAGSALAVESADAVDATSAVQTLRSIVGLSFDGL